MTLNSRTLRHVGNLVSIVTIFYLAILFKNNFDQLDTKIFNLQSLNFCFLLIVLNFLNYVLFSKAWVILLEKKYPKFVFNLAFVIICMSQIAKYLPGNVAHILGRFFLSQKHLKSGDITLTLFIETLMIAGTSLFIGCFYLIYSNFFFIISKNSFYIFLLVFLIVLISLYIILKKYKEKIDIRNINFSSLSKSLLIYLLLPIVGGFSVYIILVNILGLNTVPFALCLSAFSLSFLAGFLVPGAPGGIGVREYVFTTLLSPFIAPILALQAILILRLLSMISDIILFVVGKYLSKRLHA